MSDVPGLRLNDIEVCAQEMSRDLMQEPMLRDANPPVRIGILSVHNDTNEPFVGGSADMIVRRIQTILFRSLRGEERHGGTTAKFIQTDERAQQAVEEQRERKRRGEVSHLGLRDLHGVDYFLSGVYEALDKSAGGRRVVDMVLTFHLTDAETGEIVWTHDCPVKTVTPR